MEKSKYNPFVIKAVINKNFTFSDLSKRFENVDESTGNIYCPFHENHETPAAKMYWDENREIWVLHCFGECHRSFTAYDYVNLILCEKYQKYSSPYHFLKVNMPDTTLGLQLEIHQKKINELYDDWFQEKRGYVDNVFCEFDNISDAIEKLYTS